MSNFSQTDIDKRIQLAYCCIADLGDIVRKDFLYGKKCALQNLKKLQKAIFYLETVCNYTAISSTSVTGSGTFAITGTNGTIKPRVNGAVISDTIAFNASLATTAEDIKTGINNYISTPINYTATHTLGTSIVTVIAPTSAGANANSYKITADVTGDMAISGANATLEIAGGRAITADGDNCLTEAEMQLVFERLSTICEDCYKSPGYSYS